MRPKRLPDQGEPPAAPPETQKLRVYWLTEAFYPPIVGGQELFASQVVQALSSRGVEASVITRQSVPPSASAERLGLVEVRRFPPAGNLKGKGWRALLPILGYLSRLAVLLLKETGRYDIVVVSGAKVLPMIVVPICLLTRKKCILRVESFFELQEAVSAESLRDMSGLSARALVGFIDRLRLNLLRRSSAVIAISTEIRAGLLRRGVSAARVHDIPNAVDLKKFRPVAVEERSRLAQKLRLPAGKTLVIYAGRLSRAKGLPMLIEAWPTLIERYPELYLLIVGSGSISFDNCEDYVKEFTRTHQLEKHVQFLGESSCVQEYLQAADLFVFPTEYEGFSLALVEALACALPVAVTEVGAAPDLIEDGRNGFLFPPKNSAALVAAIEAALAARDRWPEIGAAARASVTRFDLSVVADQYLTLCRDLMRTRQAP
jgi:glycosyltransferase involved in cell wall biosynthesis